jgi:flagellar protein FliO/FliZ
MIDFSNISLYAGAAAVLVIVLLTGLILARSRGGGIRTRYGQRLGVAEYHDIDKLRRLILVKRDGVEHLLLIGPNQDLVIESGISAGANKLALDDEAPLLRRSPQRLEPAVENSERGEPPPMRPRMAPRPAVFGDRAPNLRSVEPDGPQLTSVRGDFDNPER